MTKVISFLNHKGGVGKTTSTINVGAALALLGKKVLLIDFDPQASLTQSLGIDNSKETIFTALKNEVNNSGSLPIINKQSNLDIVPSNIELINAEIMLSSEMARERFLDTLISKVKKQYDFILIDCPPALGIISINAMVASDEIIIPVQTEVLSLHGMFSIIDTIKKAQVKLNTKLLLRGFLLTQYDGRTALHKDVVENVKKMYNEKVFKTIIRRNIRLSEAPCQKIDIFSYEKTCPGATDYMNVAKELLM